MGKYKPFLVVYGQVIFTIGSTSLYKTVVVSHVRKGHLRFLINDYPTVFELVDGTVDKIEPELLCSEPRCLSAIKHLTKN